MCYKLRKGYIIATCEFERFSFSDELPNNRVFVSPQHLYRYISLSGWLKSITGSSSDASSPTFSRVVTLGEVVNDDEGSWSGSFRLIHGSGQGQHRMFRHLK